MLRLDQVALSWACSTGSALESRPAESHLSWDLPAAASNPSTVGDFICTNNTSQLDSKLRVDKYFEVEMTVQDCELDKYEVVNNAIYACYIEKGYLATYYQYLFSDFLLRNEFLI